MVFLFVLSRGFREFEVFVHRGRFGRIRIFVLYRLEVFGRVGVLLQVHCGVSGFHQVERCGKVVVAFASGFDVIFERFFCLACLCVAISYDSECLRRCDFVVC